MKFRNKIFLMMIMISLLTLVSLGAVSVIQFLHTKTEVRNRLEEQKDILYAKNMEIMTGSQEDSVKSFAYEYASTLENNLDEIEQELTVMASYLQKLYRDGISEQSAYSDSLVYLQPGVTYEEVSGEFQSIKSVRDMIHMILPEGSRSMIYYVTQSGMLLSDLEIEYGGSEVDRRERDWYIAAAESGSICWMPPYKDALTGEMTLTCSMPVIVDGELKGVIGEDIYLTDVCDTILQQDQNIFENVFLLTEDGSYIVGTQDEFDEKLSEYTKQMQQELNDGVAVRILDQERLILGSATIENTGWDVFVALDYSRLEQPVQNVGEAITESSAATITFLEQNIRNVLVSFGILALVLLLIVGVVSSAFSRTLVEPIEELTHGAEIISKGNLDYHLDIHTDGEIKNLADAFSAMTVDLKNYIENLNKVTAERERIGAELNVAAKIQEDMLPKIFPAFPDRKEFDVIAAMDPAKAVGGDFYDFFMTDDDHLAIVMSDVSSKGVPAALFMVIAKTLIKNYACQMHDLGKVYEVVNNQLCEGNEESMFVTSFMAVITISTGEMEFVNAGHNPQLWMHDGDTFDWIKTDPGFVLAGLPGIPYVSHKLQLSHGDRIFLYTDGVTEAQNSVRELFGEERLLESLNRYGRKPMDQLLPAVRADVDAFVGGAEQFDDITMLAFEYR